MVAIQNLFVFLTAVSAAAIPRDAAKVKSDLATVDSDVKALISAANSWSGSIFTVGTIKNDADKLEDDLSTAAGDAQSSGALSSSDAQAINAYIQSPLQGDIANAMTALKNKKSSIENDGLASTVKGAIQDIKNEADSFAANFKANIPSAQQGTLASSMSTIDSELQEAINEFS